MNTDDEADDVLPEGWTAQAEAKRLLAWLRANGAIIRIGDDGYPKYDLNPVAAIETYADADAVAQSILALRHELKTLLHH